MGQDATKWDAIRAEWESGADEAQLAKRYDTRLKRVASRAANEGWDSSKRPSVPAPAPVRPPARTRETVAEGTGQATGTVEAPAVEYHDPVPDDPQLLEAQHKGDWQKLRNRALTLLEGCTSPRLLAAISTALKSSSEGQRRAAGLDKEAPPATDGQHGVILSPKKDLAP